MINKKMSIEDVVKKHPETVATFERHGLGCLGCQAALFESIEQLTFTHQQIPFVGIRTAQPSGIEANDRQLDPVEINVTGIRKRALSQVCSPR